MVLGDFENHFAVLWDFSKIQGGPDLADSFYM